VIGVSNFLTRIGRIYLALVLLFLYVPIIVMSVMSFNESEFYMLPVEFSTTWYEQLLQNQEILDATVTSLWIALVTAIIATSLGTAASVAFFRYDFRAKVLFQALLFPPIAIPWLITGTAMLIFFFSIGIGRGPHAVLLGHVALALPYVIVVVMARLSSFDLQLEEAARSLGASNWEVTRHVTLPWIAPSVIAGALFSFSISFDQFVVSYFLATPGNNTLPVVIYSAIRKGFTPEINAISTIVIIASMGLMLLVARFFKFGGEN